MEKRIVQALVSVDGSYVGTAPPFEDANPWWGEVADVTAHLDDLLGVPTTVLRVLPEPGQRPPGGTVRYHVEAAATPRSDFLDKAAPDDWAEIVRPQPHRATWAEVGGPRRLFDWAAGIVPLAGTPRQVKTWNLSCLCRLPTTDGVVWAKATSTFASVDGDIIRHVRALDPSLAPEPIAVDLGRRWSLLRHAPGEDCWEPDDATVESVLRRWVAVQAALAQDVVDIEAPMSPSAGWQAALDGLVERVATSLTAEDRAGVAALTKQLPELVARLDSAGLPTTVVHGDFHPGNWRSDGNRRVVFDWCDASRGHPACDLIRLTGWLPAPLAALATNRWVAEWRTAVPGSDPGRAAELVRPVQHLELALTYQGFLDGIEPDERPYHEDDPADEIRLALAAV
jgi:Phosphotransferase enzyme family